MPETPEGIKKLAIWAAEDPSGIRAAEVCTMLALSDQIRHRPELQDRALKLAQEHRAGAIPTLRELNVRFRELLEEK